LSRLDSADPPQANPAVRRGHDRRPQGPVDTVVQSLKMAWRWLTRMRTALYLLGILGIETLLATVIPQSPNVPTTVNAWRAGTEGPGLVVSNLIDMIGGYDLYGSALFLATLLLLFLSLTACLIPRIRAWVRLVRRGRPPRAGALTGQPHVASFVTDRPADEVHAQARTLLDRRWRLRSADADPGRVDQVAAERGIITREGGSLAFHLSFYVLLVAVVFGQLLGFSGQVGVIEGEATTDTPVAYWRATPGRWWGPEDHRAFTMTLDEFRVDWHRDPSFGGQPSLFESVVTVEEAGGRTYTDTIGGNDPLIVDGMKIHQLGWGYAPRVIISDGGDIVHDGYLTANMTDGGFFRTAAKAPRADPDIGLQLRLFPYAPEGEDGEPRLTGAPWAEAPLLMFEAYRGDLRLDRVQNVSTLDLTGLESQGGGYLRLGQTVVLPDGMTITFLDLRRWVGFQMSYRPTVPWLLLGGTMMFVGLVASLYAYRRRLWVQAESRPGGGTLVRVAGRAFQRPAAFADEFDRLVERLRVAVAGEQPGGAATDADLAAGSGTSAGRTAATARPPAGEPES
jgi:cytochrome c biogenesis protein